MEKQDKKKGKGALKKKGKASTETKLDFLGSPEGQDAFTSLLRQPKREKWSIAARGRLTSFVEKNHDIWFDPQTGILREF